MFNLFNSNKSLTYNAAIKLVYDNNIHTLRSRIKILIVDDEKFDIVQILRERKYDIYYKKDITFLKPSRLILSSSISKAWALLWAEVWAASQSQKKLNSVTPQSKYSATQPVLSNRRLLQSLHKSMGISQKIRMLIPGVKS